MGTTRTLTQLRNAYSPSKQPLWWVTAIIIGHQVPITLMLCPQLHKIKYKVGFSAAYYYYYHYFKAASQVLVWGLLSVLCFLGYAVLVIFQVLARSLVVPTLILGSGKLKPIELLFHAFGVAPAFPGIVNLLLSVGKHSCLVHSSSYTF